MHVFVTGAASGIGFTLTRMLLRRGHTVTAMARSAERAMYLKNKFARQKGELHTCFADLASFGSLQQMVDTQLERQTRFDVVVHCAGMLMPPVQPTETQDGIEITLQVNAVSVWRLSHLLLPRMNRPGHIIALTSSLHKPGSRGESVAFDFDDIHLKKNYHRERAYKNSKLALIWLLREWELKNGSTGIHADAICPGFVPTTAARYTHGATWLLMKLVLPLMPFAVSRRKAARDILRLVEEPAERTGGRYFENDRLATPSAVALDAAKAKRFVAWVDSTPPPA